MNENYKMEISEPDFSLKVSEWTPLTKNILKIITDNKCNNNKENKTLNGLLCIGKKIDEVASKIEPLLVLRNEPITDIKPETESDTRFIPDSKETEDNIPTEKEKQDLSTVPEKKLKIYQYKVKQEEILATDGNMKIYKQVEEYLEKNLPDNFTREDMIDLVIKAWKKIFNQELSLGSAKTYWIKYKRYMEKQGLIKEDENYHYHKVKKDENEPEDKDDDLDDGKDHCYLPEWTNDEIDVLGDTIFRFPTIEEGIANVAEKLHKTYDEVKLKAKKRGMILR